MYWLKKNHCLQSRVLDILWSWVDANFYDWCIVVAKSLTLEQLFSFLLLFEVSMLLNKLQYAAKGFHIQYYVF